MPAGRQRARVTAWRTSASRSRVTCPCRASVVFDELIDWKGHANWVPLTRVEILSGDGGPGTEFVATSGARATGPARSHARR